MNNLAWEVSDQKREFTFVNTYCGGVGNMFNPIKDQMENTKSAIQELKDAGKESEFGSVSSGSPDREDRRRSQGDVQSISMEALREMQRQIDCLSEERRQ